MIGFILGGCLCAVTFAATCCILFCSYYFIKGQQLEYYNEVRRYRNIIK